MKKLFLISSLIAFYSCNDHPEKQIENKSSRERADATEKKDSSEVLKDVQKTDKEIVNHQNDQGLTPEMIAVFEKFRQVMLTNDCKGLVEFTSFPVTGDCGLYRLLGGYDGENAEEKAKDFRYQINKKLLLKNCNFLEKIELKTLKEFNVNSENKEIKYKNCMYKGQLIADKKGKFFTWSEGCVNLIDSDYGEYRICVKFNLIDGVFKLKEIYCVG